MLLRTRDALSTCLQSRANALSITTTHLVLQFSNISLLVAFSNHNNLLLQTAEPSLRASA